MPKKLILCIILCAFFLSCASSKTMEKGHQDNFNPLFSVVRFYRGPLNHLSAVRHGECPMYPSCSEYSLQCFQKFGQIIGWTMTCDRLMRCGRDEMKASQRLFIGGKWQYYDPVEENVFWQDNESDISIQQTEYKY
ncbi:MAG: membrane protein insertion efficiency factor YidD [Desulfobacteraceae bacterium]|nr:membrane protein insertion efficiency factor YidD [Desulfobacteraceae bacterium]